MFQPDYKNILDAALNKKPKRLPLYEHIISPIVMEKILGRKFDHLFAGNDRDIAEFFRHYCAFFKEMTYDTVSYESSVIYSLPDSGAIRGGRPGPIQNRKDFDNFPWDCLAERFWKQADREFKAMAVSIPNGMKAIGGIGNGVFEISEDLVGFEYLPFMQIDDPELFAMIYSKIGDLLVEIWQRFLKVYGNLYCVCRFGDDLGFKTGLLTHPQVFAQHILPQYKRIVSLIHQSGKPFLWHSCGCIFEVMETMITETRIDAKHSNEDAVASYDKWVELYAGRIGLFGGIDVDILCSKSSDYVYEFVREAAMRFRATANGFALGSGNSIPDYVPVEGYLAMVRAGQAVRDMV